jgi:RNA polymerase sigma-70 factor (ECF subfamily)
MSKSAAWAGRATLAEDRASRLPPEPAALSVESPGGAAVNSYKETDTAFFSELMQQCDQRVYLLALRITRNQEDAEDAHQEAMLKAHRHRHQFEGRSRFTTWISRIAINEALMTLRKRRRSKQVPLESMPEQSECVVPSFGLVAHVEDPETYCSRGQLRESLLRAVRSLRMDYRQVFILRAIEERSMRETAQVLNLSVSTVKTRLRRARRELRGMLLANQVREAA